MKIVSLITARGGSKGIPKKNIIEVNGYPLIYHTIKASKESEVHETWVSTDNLEIAEIAKNFGARVVLRPPELADDKIMPDASLLHFLNNYDFDILVFIQPTSPLVKSKFINKGLQKIKRCDSVFSAYKEHWLPRWDKNKTPINWNLESRPRRQDIEEVYVENGAFYITTRQQLKKSGLRYGGKIEIVEMPQSLSYQVDTLDDLKIIRRLM